MPLRKIFLGSHDRGLKMSDRTTAKTFTTSRKRPPTLSYAIFTVANEWRRVKDGVAEGIEKVFSEWR